MVILPWLPKARMVGILKIGIVVTVFCFEVESVIAGSGYVLHSAITGFFLCGGKV